MSTQIWKWGPVLAIALLGAALSAAAFRMAERADDERVRRVVELRAEWRAKDLERKIASGSTDTLNAAAAFLALTPGFDARDFEAVGAISRVGGDQALALLWAPRVPAEERAAHTAQARAAGLDGYEIREPAPDGTLRLAAPREEYFPVRHAATFAESPRLFGFDLAYEPVRRAAVHRARDQGQAIATGPLVLSATGERGHLVFRPVFAGGLPESVERRRAQLRGFAVAVFHFEDVLNAALEGTPPLRSNIHFFVGAHSAAEHAPGADVHVATYIAAEDRFTTATPEALITRPAVRTERSFEVLGQHWHVVFEFDAAAVRELRSWGPGLVLLLGLLVTALLAVYVQRERMRALRAESDVAQRTADLGRAAREREDIIDASLLAIIALDPAYKVMTWNRAAERIFGYSAEEVVGRPYPLVPPEGRAEFDAMFARVAAGEIIRDMQVRRRHKDGRLVDVVFSGVRLLDAAGRFRGALFTLDDVSERLSLQQQLVQAQKMEAVGQLTGGIAHDFNNVLGAVIGNLDLALEELADRPATRQLVQDALDGALRGAELVKRLLAFSRRQPLQPRVIDIGETIEGMVPLLRRALGERIRVTTATAGAGNVVADPVQLENAILNRAINARDAMPDGGTLAIEACHFDLDDAFAAVYRDLPPGPYVQIAVSDTGAGMPPDVLARAFEPFFTTKGTGAGTGLGLSMVYGYVKQSGGSVKIYSEVGRGTTVRLFLPRAAAQTADAAGAADTHAAMPGGSERILVVEDNPDMRRVATGILARLGYALVEAADAEQGLAALERERFDLLFTDVVMPGAMNGLGLACEARRRWPAMPVVLTSGFSSRLASDAEIRALDAALIVKPYRKADLAHVIRNALDRARTTEAA